MASVVTSEHIHHVSANRWWEQETRRIGFSRLTQLGFLRLMTTSAAMDGKPLTMAEAWRVHDPSSTTTGVAFIPEPTAVEARFRVCASGRTASPKLWADAWLEAFAECAGAVMVTFDRAFAARTRNAILLS
ncbi:MAG: VapC toxin family PIN domain ribonuclease [Bryobacteraceae bacterium]|jgi:predicted nucleic acid-binding protein